MAILDIERFAHFMGRDASDDAVAFAVEMAEILVLAQAGSPSNPPAGLAAVTFSVASRLIAAPVGVGSESEGGTSFGYKPDAGTLALTDVESKMVALVMNKRGGLGEIGLTTPGAGVRRFDPDEPLRRRYYDLLNDHPARGHWARGSE